MTRSLLSIGEVTKILDVSIDTLRRWDKRGILNSIRLTPTSPRKYLKEDVYTLLLKEKLSGVARSWVSSESPIEIPDFYYCKSRDIFQVRLESLSIRLSRDSKVATTFPLIVSIVGEIGNNSFDHNINWPDIPGIFFGYDLERSQIVLADRGQGILHTLSRVDTTLKRHDEALKVAFTKVISGRAPEARGNGLKYVKKYITQLSLGLLFQTGDALLELNNNNPVLNITNTPFPLNGCLAVINY